MAFLIVAEHSTTSNSTFSPLRSAQNPTGCMEIPAARLTQELAGYPLAVSERPPATKNAPIDVGGCLNSWRVASG